MKKIISLFKRNYETDHKVRNEVVEGAEWVINGEGTATRKYDGACCQINKGKLFKRYEVKKDSKPPFGFIPANDIDEITGKQQGWIEVGNDNTDKWFREAIGGDLNNIDLLDGTYELVGPKVNGNPDKYEKHTLVRHLDAEEYLDFPRDFEGIKNKLLSMNIEGIVWHHPDGRMVKIKKKDF